MSKTKEGLLGYQIVDMIKEKGVEFTKDAVKAQKITKLSGEDIASIAEVKLSFAELVVDKVEEMELDGWDIASIAEVSVPLAERAVNNAKEITRLYYCDNIVLIAEFSGDLAKLAMDKAKIGGNLEQEQGHNKSNSMTTTIINDDDQPSDNINNQEFDTLHIKGNFSIKNIEKAIKYITIVPSSQLCIEDAKFKGLVMFAKDSELRCNVIIKHKKVQVGVKFDPKLYDEYPYLNDVNDFIAFSHEFEKIMKQVSTCMQQTTFFEKYDNALKLCNYIFGKKLQNIPQPIIDIINKYFIDVQYFIPFSTTETVPFKFEKNAIEEEKTLIATPFYGIYDDNWKRLNFPISTHTDIDEERGKLLVGQIIETDYLLNGLE